MMAKFNNVDVPVGQPSAVHIHRLISTSLSDAYLDCCTPQLRSYIRNFFIKEITVARWDIQSALVAMHGKYDESP
jgi:hypothetical protein